MDNVRNYPGNYLLKTEKFVKLLGVMILWHFLIEVCWAHDTKVFIFYFPCEHAGVRDGWQICLAHVNMGYLQEKRGSDRYSMSLCILFLLSHHKV